MAEVSGIPLGFWNAGAINGLFPYQPDMRGIELFPDSADLPFIIQTTAGKSMTFAKAALMESPSISFTPTKAMFGAAKWTCLRATGTTGSTAGNFVTIATSAYTAPAITPSAILTGRYVLSFGDGAVAPMNNIQFKDEVAFSVKIGTKPIMVQGVIVGYWLDSVTAQVTFEPVNLSESDLYASLEPMDGTGSGAGTDVSGLGGALTVTGQATGQPILTFPLGFASDSSLKFATDGRVGKITVEAMRKAVSGVLQPLYALTTAA